MVRCSVFLLLTTCLLACQEEVLDPEITAVHESFVAAIRAGDVAKLYEMTPDEARAYFDKLWSTWFDVATRVKEQYPAHERDAALEALAWERLKDLDSGRAMFTALIDFDNLNAGADSGVERGLKPVSIQRGDGEATVETASGERFRYVLEGETWRAATILAQLERYPTLKRLRANLKVAHANLGTRARASAESTDLRKPQGAYNVVLLAVRRGARVMLFQQLDDASRKHVEAALAVIKQLQEATEKRFPGADARRTYLASRNIAWIERVADAPGLFAGLWDEGGLKAALPVPETGDIAIGRVETGAVETDVTVHGKVGETPLALKLARVVSGHYRLAQLEPNLVKELRRLEAELRAVPAGTQQQ